MFTRTRLTAAASSFIFCIALLTIALSSQASATGTWHSVTSASKANFSAAVESPTWSFACNPATKAWKFSINDVQVIDSSGKPWSQDGRRTGPWNITFWSAPSAGPVPFSETTILAQNNTNGLFTSKATGTASNAKTWCVTGGSVTVVGFSGVTQPLLLDGTLS
jgi:hypothetical protein